MVAVEKRLRDEEHIYEQVGNKVRETREQWQNKSDASRLKEELRMYCSEEDKLNSKLREQTEEYNTNLLLQRRTNEQALFGSQAYMENRLQSINQTGDVEMRANRALLEETTNNLEKLQNEATIANEEYEEAMLNAKLQNREKTLENTKLRDTETIFR